MSREIGCSYLCWRGVVVMGWGGGTHLKMMICSLMQHVSAQSIGCVECVTGACFVKKKKKKKTHKFIFQTIWCHYLRPLYVTENSIQHHDSPVEKNPPSRTPWIVSITRWHRASSKTLTSSLTIPPFHSTVSRSDRPTYSAMWAETSLCPQARVLK